jgi:1-acyl-sn-glycerol-3-phosphate acyltransferase
MKLLKNIFRVIWKAWFYGWVLFTIVPIFPFLLILLSRDEWYPIFFKIANAWAKTILFVMGFKMDVEGAEKIDKHKSYLFCPNHTSMIDIMLMFAISKNPFVFVGKKELKKIPVFGYVFKKSSILVDRSSRESSKKAFNDAQNKLAQGRSICIFPEGGVPDESIVLDNFKSGAFRMAIEHKIPIVPITFYDCKKRFSYTFFSGSPGKLRVKIHNLIPTENYTMEDRNELKQKTYDVIYQSLIVDTQK